MNERKAILTVISLSVLLAVWAVAGNLEPSAAPGPTMKTLDVIEPRIPISQADIPKTIDKPGSYYLTEDVTGFRGILVQADDVTIDLGGFALVGTNTGTGYFGVSLSGRNNVEIRNGTIRGFNVGIYESNSSGRGHRVINVRAVSNLNMGIVLNGSGHLVKDCTVNDNGLSSNSYVYGIRAGSDSVVTGNTISGNGELSNYTVYGIHVDHGCTVTGNTSNNNGKTASGTIYGIYSAYGGTVSGNTTNGNGESATGGTVYGIYANSGSTVTGNTARNNGTWATVNVRGIYANTGSTVIGNTAYGNGISSTGPTVYGINLGGHNLADQNTAYGNIGSNGGTNMNAPTNCTFGTNHAP